jgi:K+-transporting ATPase KdpF subunit
MSAVEAIGLALALGLAAYLTFALLRGEEL